jgi:hypothetical protein
VEIIFPWNVFFSIIHLPFSMMQFMLWSFFLLISSEISATSHVGRIQNAWWDQSATTIQNWTVSCEECICTMMMPSSDIVGLNYLLTNRTCYLFADYSNESSTIQSYMNSTFYFRVLPSTSTPASLTTVANQLVPSKIQPLSPSTFFV